MAPMAISAAAITVEPIISNGRRPVYPRCLPWLAERIPLRHGEISEQSGTYRVAFAPDRGRPACIVAQLRVTEADATIDLLAIDPAPNRFSLRVVAEAGEHVWGGGEQRSYFDLRGRRFPLWTAEPGVRRDKSSEITLRADREGNAGGDFWTTSYPHPTFLSSRKYALHIETRVFGLRFSRLGLA